MPRLCSGITGAISSSLLAASSGLGEDFRLCSDNLDNWGTYWSGVLYTVPQFGFLWYLLVVTLGLLDLKRRTQGLGVILIVSCLECFLSAWLIADDVGLGNWTDRIFQFSWSNIVPPLPYASHGSKPLFSRGAGVERKEESLVPEGNASRRGVESLFMATLVTGKHTYQVICRLLLDLGYSDIYLWLDWVHSVNSL